MKFIGRSQIVWDWHDNPFIPYFRDWLGRQPTQLIAVFSPKMTITVDISHCKKRILSISVHSLGDGIHIEEHFVDFDGKRPTTIVFTKPTYGGGFEMYLKVKRHRKVSEEYDDADYITYHLRVYHHSDRVFTSDDFIKDERKITTTTPWVCSCLGRNYSTSWICQYCFQNRAKNVLSGLAMIPFLGVPFGAASAVLAWGQFLSSNAVHLSVHNLFTAIFDSLLCVVDLAGIGVLIGMGVRLVMSAMRAGELLTRQLLQSCIQQTMQHAGEHAVCFWAEACVHFGHILERCTSAGRVQYRKLQIEILQGKNH